MSDKIRYDEEMKNNPSLQDNNFNVFIKNKTKINLCFLKF